MQILERAEPDEAVHHDARNIMVEYHERLRFTELDYPVLCILWASSTDGEPAVMRHGYPCAGIVSVIPYKQRVDKRADAEFIIDKLRWSELRDRQRLALLDHLINHLELALDAKGFRATDDLGRPKLRLRPCDWMLSGFHIIARRYGADAIEVGAARDFQKKFGLDVLAPAESMFQ